MSWSVGSLLGLGLEPQCLGLGPHCLGLGLGLGLGVGTYCFAPITAAVRCLQKNGQTNFSCTNNGCTTELK